MKKQDLIDLIANGESSGVEFKRDDIRPEQLAREIVALANLKGGRILLGVENDGVISGITRSNLSEWIRFVDVEIAGYGDRLEIVSPGALPNAMTVEKMLAGQRSARNHIIVEVLRDYGYVDARGMGIRTKVIPLMQAQNGVDPVFEATEDFVKTVLGAQKGCDTQRGAPKKHDSQPIDKLKVRSSTVDASINKVSHPKIEEKEHDKGGGALINASITDTQMHLLELIRAEPSISYDRLAEKLAVDRTTVMRNIQKLKQIGVLRRHGARKRGHWEVIG